MVNRPRNIGTAAETAVVKVLRQHWPTADRSPLRGTRDQGDIRGTGDFIWEVKAGEAARGNKATGEIPPSLLAEWLGQTEIERGHAGVKYGILVTVRRGVGAENADRWYAWLPFCQLMELLGEGDRWWGSSHPIRLELRHLLSILADAKLTDPATW